MRAQTKSQALVDRLAITIVIALLSSGLTYLEVVRPSIHDISAAIDRFLPAGQTPAPSPSKSPVPATAPAPAPKPAVKTATTAQTVYFRSTKSTGGPVIEKLEPGTVVQLRNDSDATWQGVTYGGKDGYIYKAYLSY